MSHPFNRDAELLAAFDLWRNACEVTGPDSPGEAEYDAAVIAERENCRKVVSLPAFTADGVLVKLAALLDLATDTFQGDDDHPVHEAIATLRVAGSRSNAPHARATQRALDMVLVLAEGYHAKASTASPLPALYRRWVDLQARYCSGEGVDSRPEEAELEKALDDAEDRLALEPVRAPIDVIVKVAAFLSEAVRIASDEQVPIIDANSDMPWPRLIPITEAGVTAFNPEERAPVLALTKAVRDVVGIMDKADRRAAQMEIDKEHRLAAAKHGASLLSDMEHPLIMAEGVASTLILLAQSISDKETANSVAYLANQLVLHLGEVRSGWEDVQTQIQDAGGGPC